MAVFSLRPWPSGCVDRRRPNVSPGCGRAARRRACDSTLRNSHPVQFDDLARVLRRSHHLPDRECDRRSPHPLAVSADCGRVRRRDYDTDDCSRAVRRLWLDIMGRRWKFRRQRLQKLRRCPRGRSPSHGSRLVHRFWPSCIAVEASRRREARRNRPRTPLSRDRLDRRERARPHRPGRARHHGAFAGRNHRASRRRTFHRPATAECDQRIPGTNRCIRPHVAGRGANADRVTCRRS